MVIYSEHSIISIKFENPKIIQTKNFLYAMNLRFKGRGVLMYSFQLTKEDANRLVQKYATPLEVISTKHIEENYLALKRHIPRLKIFYAIKANPADCILHKLSKLGANFDVASDGEIYKLHEMGVDGSRMIYANPVRSLQGLKAAAKVGIQKFTFDSKDEIDKIINYVPNAEVLARVKIDHSDAVIDLNIKFGVDKSEVIDLLKYAQSKGLSAVGICFHVGSQTMTSKAYLHAFKIARELIDKARQNGLNIKYLDIGGGLPAPAIHKHIDVTQIMQDINKCIEQDFTDVEVWAEPGRYMCASAVNIITSVVGRQKRNNREWYFLDDGIYGSFSGIMFDHWDYDFIPLKSGELQDVTLAGPSCDSLDIVKKHMLCPKLDVGDLLLAINSGAYSTVSATTFNGFSLPQVVEWK